MKRIPYLLIYLRLLLGPLLLLLAFSKLPQYPICAISILVAGLLSDVFDGIIARRLGLSTQRLRRMDSSVDQVFFICVAVATYVQCPEFFHLNAWKIITVLALEGLAYLVCYLKFRKEIATHSIGAKLWTLLIVATLVEIMLSCRSGFLFAAFFYAGVLTRLEIIAIILVLKKWENDVPSLYHAFQIRAGKPIKRHKLFNG